MAADNHEIPGAWATPGHAADPQHARARVIAMIDRFTDVSDLMVSKADLRALVALSSAPADDEAAVERMRQAIHDELCACEGGVSPCPHSSVELNAAARAALAALREGQQ